MKTIIAIPARYKSSRFPGKPLTRLAGKAMIKWVAELSAWAIDQENVFVATDDNEILRFFEWGKSIRLVKTSDGSLAVDRPEDVEKVEAALKRVSIK